MAADRDRWDALYLSPHFDDAALSCGGQIARRTRRGERVLVVTVFAAPDPPSPPSGFARRLHRIWGLDDGAVVAARRREDRRACEILGAAAAAWPFREAIYRLRPADGRALYPGRRALFGAHRDGDPLDLDALAQRLASAPAAGRVAAPLAAGGHVDHRLLRRAAERVFGDRLALYEDLPYAARRGAVRRALAGADLEERVEELAAEDLEAKVRAVAAHASQVRMLFGSRRRMERRIRRWARRAGGERSWVRRGAGSP